MSAFQGACFGSVTQGNISTVARRQRSKIVMVAWHGRFAMLNERLS
jgi:hypothetical protein